MRVLVRRVRATDASAIVALLNPPIEAGSYSVLDRPISCRGIGRRLTETTLRAALAQGFRKISATIRADNPGAVAFYASQGFRRIGIARQHALVRGRYLDEVLAEKFIA